jgi:hypothetical protein
MASRFGGGRVVLVAVPLVFVTETGAAAVFVPAGAKGLGG